MKLKQQIDNYCKKCITEGKIVIGTQWTNRGSGDFIIMNPTTYVDLEDYSKWNSNCQVLLQLIGNISKPWEKTINDCSESTLVNAKKQLGALRSIQDSISEGLLVRAEDIVYAEAFSNLIDQAEYLFEQKYLLASGVILRAILEEKLRLLCSEKNIQVNKSRPTLNDYNTELYKASIIDKIIFKRIDSLIVIGNEAAHNQQITESGIKDLLNGTIEVLSRMDGI